MTKPSLIALFLLVICAAFAFSGGKGEKDNEDEGELYYTGSGGAGINIGFYKPVGENLGENSEEKALPGLVESILKSNVNTYSAITFAVVDDEELAKIQKARVEMEALREARNEEAITEQLIGDKDITHYLSAKISKISPKEYSLELTVTDIITKVETTVSKRGTPEELRDGVTLNQATADILTKFGVDLTSAAKNALAMPLKPQIIESQTALAMSNVAPTEFERMQYAYRAAEIDPNLKEAAQRRSEYQETILSIPTYTAPVFAPLAFTLPKIQESSTGNIGTDARNRLAHYQATQAALKEQQQTLLRQRQDILDQWQGFLAQIDTQREPLLEHERRLFLQQEELTNLLVQAESFYTEHPPFRIFYNHVPEEYGEINFRNKTMNLRFAVASEPVTVEALKNVLDALVNLNKSFTVVNKAYTDVNEEIAKRFNQTETAMNAVQNALAKVNDLGQQYDVAAVSAHDWTVPPGTMVYGAPLTTAWDVDYLRSFSIDASLLDDSGIVIGRGTVTLVNDVSWNGPLKPETAFGWCTFNNVTVDDISDTLTVRIDRVNERGSDTGYIAIDPNGAQTAVIQNEIASQESWRKYWSDTSRLTSLGVAAGTTGGTVTPAFLVSARATFSPFSHGFFEIGSDFGLVHGERDVQDVEYFSIAPYLHYSSYAGGQRFSGYAGIGFGGSFSRYTYPSESNVDPVEVNTWVADANFGLLLKLAHSGIDLRWTIKTNFKGLDHRFTLGYLYRFGYIAERYGGKPANLMRR
jgi:hypothetical protein